jgi:hypothetical protein
MMRRPFILVPPACVAMLALAANAIYGQVAAPQIVPNTIDPTMQGNPVSIQFSVPAAPNTCFNWSLTGTPPPGLSLVNTAATAASTYQGTPTTANVNPYSFTISAAATACPGGPTPPPLTLNQPLTHLIFAPVDISPTAAANGVAGVPYSQTFNQVGGYGTGGMFVTTGTLPPGLTFNSTGGTGVLAGTPTTTGSYTFTLEVFDSFENSRTRTYTVVISAFVPLTFVTAPVLPNATVGTPYSTALQTAGGIPPVSGAPGQTPPLPPGLTLNLTNLTITGTPLSPGTYSFPVAARDSQGNTATRTFSITVLPVFRIITPLLPGGILGQIYNAFIQTEGGTPPILFQLTGTLPPGLSFDPANGQFFGIPTALGQYQLSVTATSGNRTTSPAVYTVSVVAPALDFTPEALPNGSVGVPYQAQFSPVGGTGSYRFGLAPGSSMPGGLSLSASGLVSGTPSAEGTFRFVVELSSGDNSVQKLVRIVIDPAPIAVTPETLPEGTRGTAYQATFGATGGTGPYTFRVSSGQLPAGLSLTPAGSLAGTPSAAGTSRFTIQATDSRQRNGSRDYEIVVREALRITTESLPSGAQGEAYSGLIEATGGAAPYTFTLAGGALPPGVGLASDGRLSGTPTQSGRFTASVQASDRGNRTARRDFVIDIIGALRLLPDSLPGGSVGRAYSATLSAEGGQAPYTFAVSGALPAGITFANGAFSGTPSQSGQFSITGQVTDAARRVVNRQYTITIAAPPPLRVSGSPGPGTVGAAYQAQFSAEGGVPPYTFSASGLPPGLTISPEGLLSGTPSAGGTYGLTVTATGAFNTQGAGNFSITISLPATPPATVSVSNPNAGAGQQTPVALTLSSPYPVPITGFLELTFAPVRGGDDPAIQFSNGGRRINFAIPAGQTAAVFTPPQAAVQTGTVAGTITILATMQAGGSDITPTPRPSSQIRIPGGPPVITRVEVSRTATGSDLIVFGYATTREMTQGLLRLTPRSGVTLSQSEFTIALTSVFATWYASEQSVQFGSQFRLVIPLTGVNTESVESLTIQLSNPAGSSETARFTF